MSIYKRGNVYWTRFYLKCADGKIRRRFFSLETENRREATDLERDKIAEKRKEVQEAIEKARRETRPETDNFAELPFHLEGGQLGALEEYLRDRKPEFAASTQQSERNHSRALAEFFGPMPVGEIGAAKAREYVARRNAEGIANATLNKELAVLIAILERARTGERIWKAKGRRHFMCWKMADGEIEKLPVRTSKVARVLEQGEKLRLLKVAAANPNWNHARRAMLLALNTTMRAGEIRNLQWRDVNWLDRSLIVRRGKTEESQREIPLNGEAYALLDAMRKEVKADGGVPPAGHYVFFSCPTNEPPDQAKPMSSWRSAWRALTRAVECPECGLLQRPAAKCAGEKCEADLSKIRSPLHGLRFHDLRHQAITELSEGQASDETIMSIAGHVDRRMMSHYSHVRKAARRAAVECLRNSIEVEQKNQECRDSRRDSESATLSQLVEKNGGDDGTRTRDLCRDRAAF